jgi:hypothetical protein
LDVLAHLEWLKKYSDHKGWLEARQRLGLRWQSAAATPLLARTKRRQVKKGLGPHESGVALRFPPQSKKVTGMLDPPLADRDYSSY